jgi:hypothetical protein
MGSEALRLDFERKIRINSNEEEKPAHKEL